MYKEKQLLWYRKAEDSSYFQLIRIIGDSIFPIQKPKVGKSNLLEQFSEWTCIGPWCGDIGSLVLSPYFPIDSTLFAGTVGAIHKSTDCGKHWIRSCTGIQESGYCRLAIGKGVNGTIVLFASTWKGNLYRSDDEGETWYPCSNFLPDNKIFAIAISPNFAKDSLILIGTGGWAFQGSVYKSEDGGKSWQNIGAPLDGKHITDVCISPNFDQDSVVFVGTEYNGVYGSFDACKTWIQLNVGLGILSVNQIAISPAFESDSIVFLTQSYRSVVYRSQNGGRSWHKVLTASFASDVVISPNFSEDKEVFVGSLDFFGRLYKSTDGGDTWTNLDGPYFNVWKIALSPNYATDSTLFVGHGNAGGISYSSDRGNTWESRHNGISSLETISIGVSPNFETFPVVFANPDYVAGIFRTMDGGTTWEILDKGVSPNNWAISYSISPGILSDSTIFFADWFDGVYRSVDLGNSWILCDNGYPPLGRRYTREVRCSPSYPEDSIVFACLLDSTTRRSYDRANTWELCPGGSYVRNNNDIAFSPAFKNDSTIFMIKSHAIVIMSMDGGNSWQRRDNGLYGYLKKIAVSPDFPNDSMLLVIGSVCEPEITRILFQSTNAGLSWEEIFTYPGYVQDVQFSPSFATDGTIFLGSEKGIYISTDRGKDWKTWNEGFGAPPYVTELTCSSIQDGTFYVFAATWGQGVWMRKYSVEAVEEASVGKKNELQSLNIYPNPFVHRTTVQADSLHDISLYDICGRKVGNLSGNILGKELNPGIYFVKVQGYRATKIVKLR